MATYSEDAKDRMAAIYSRTHAAAIYRGQSANEAERYARHAVKGWLALLEDLQKDKTV